MGVPCVGGGGRAWGVYTTHRTYVGVKEASVRTRVAKEEDEESVEVLRKPLFFSSYNWFFGAESCPVSAYGRFDSCGICIACLGDVCLLGLTSLRGNRGGGRLGDGGSFSLLAGGLRADT